MAAVEAGPAGPGELFVVIDGGDDGEQVRTLPWRRPEGGNIARVFDAVEAAKALHPANTLRNVWVYRPTAVPAVERIRPVDWAGFIQGQRADENHLLQPGDRVYIKASKRGDCHPLPTAGLHERPVELPAALVPMVPLGGGLPVAPGHPARTAAGRTVRVDRTRQVSPVQMTGSNRPTKNCPVRGRNLWQTRASSGIIPFSTP